MDSERRAVMIVKEIHHVAIICSNYQRSKKFYTELLGFKVLHEAYRSDRDSYKLDLGFGKQQIELFSFPNPPARPSRPEAMGLRHLAFSVDNITTAREYLLSHGVDCEPLREDPYTGRKFFFFQDPDSLPLEFYEST